MEHTTWQRPANLASTSNDGIGLDRASFVFLFFSFVSFRAADSFPFFFVFIFVCIEMEPRRPHLVARPVSSRVSFFFVVAAAAAAAAAIVVAVVVTEFFRLLVRFFMNSDVIQGLRMSRS